MAHYAQRYDVDDVFCGRIHSAAIREFGNACKLRQKCYQAFDLPMSVNAVPAPASDNARSEEHTSELQSQSNLVCRLLLEKKNIYTTMLHLNTSAASSGQSDQLEIIHLNFSIYRHDACFLGFLLHPHISSRLHSPITGLHL